MNNIILKISILISFILMGMMMYKSKFGIDKSKEVYNNSYLPTQKRQTQNNSKNYFNGIQPILEKKPELRYLVNDNFYEIKDTITYIDEYIDWLCSMDFENRRQRHQYFNKEKTDSIALMLNNCVNLIEKNYQESIDSCNYFYSKIIHNELKKINIGTRLQELKYLNKEKASLVLNSILLDLYNLEYDYIINIANIINQKEDDPFDKLKVYAYTGKHTKDSFNIMLRPINYYSSNDSLAYLTIRNKKYFFDENGMIKYSEIPHKKGKNSFKIKSIITNKISKELMSSSINWTYEVLE